MKKITKNSKIFRTINQLYFINRIKEYGLTGFEEGKFDRIYLKKGEVKTNRKNIGSSYHGLLRIRIRKSTNLNRKIAGWIEKITKICGVV